MGKHFRVVITDTELRYERDEQKIAEEAALDGLYVVRTSVPKELLAAEQTVGASKKLSVVERAFRSFKTVDLHVRPIHHRLADRVRAHVFLCMLAYYVEWHMRQRLAPILFDDDDRDAAAARRESIVEPAQRSPSAEHKAARKRTADGTPVHSFRSLLAELGTIAKNRIRPKAQGAQTFDMVTTPTPFQKRAFDLLGIRLLP